MNEHRRDVPIVVKVGGSLFDLPILANRLETWLRQFPDQNVILVPGGGRTADAVRRFDAAQRIGEEAAHWLALAALTLNGRLLQRLLPSAVVTGLLNDKDKDHSRYLILDAYTFAADDEQRRGALPHTWNATSDAVAARVADVAGAEMLFLLKSVTIPGEMNWFEAARAGYVDPVFPIVLQNAERPIKVTAINFRKC